MTWIQATTLAARPPRTPIDWRPIGASVADCWSSIASRSSPTLPTALVGEYGENPLSAVLFALALTIISGLETVMLWHAMRAGLTRVRPLPRPAYRYALVQSAIPTVLIAASIPVAYASTIAAMTMWILAIPLGRIIDRIWPSGAGAYTEVFKASRATSEGSGSS
jgi:hypothetical protein